MMLWRLNQKKYYEAFNRGLSADVEGHSGKHSYWFPCGTLDREIGAAIGIVIFLLYFAHLLDDNVEISDEQEDD